MTVSRWYVWTPITSDEELHRVLGRYANKGRIMLKDALRLAAISEALFGIKSKIESRSPFGTIVVERRNKPPLQAGGIKQWECPHDEELADVLNRYAVRDVNLVTALLGNVGLSMSVRGDEAQAAYKKIADNAGTGQPTRV